MSATTPRKRRAGRLSEGQILATNLFKGDKFTSDWTEHDAKTYFGMRKSSRSVFKTGRDDKTPVEWYLDPEDKVQKREVV